MLFRPLQSNTAAHFQTVRMLSCWAQPNKEVLIYLGHSLTWQQVRAGHISCWRLQQPKLSAFNSAIHLNAHIFLWEPSKTCLLRVHFQGMPLTHLPTHNARGEENHLSERCMQELCFLGFGLLLLLSRSPGNWGHFKMADSAVWQWGHTVQVIRYKGLWSDKK